MTYTHIEILVLNVYKSWFSLISNPHFAISHFELAATHTHTETLCSYSELDPLRLNKTGMCSLQI